MDSNVVLPQVLPVALLLGVFYFRNNRFVPNIGQGWRDAVRGYALERCGYRVLSLDNKHNELMYGNDDKLHCNANFGDPRRMMISIFQIFGLGIIFNTIILDYFFCPSGWARTRWTDNFYKRTIPEMYKIVAAGGTIWLPCVPCVIDSLNEFRSDIFPYYTVTLVKDPMLNPLFMATEGATEELLQGPDKMTNETQLRYLSNYSKTPFVMLTRRDILVHNKYWNEIVVDTIEHHIPNPKKRRKRSHP